VRIVAAADLHFSESTRERVTALAGAMCRSGADALVLAGDAVAGGPEDLAEVLALFADYSGPKLMVAGNHDLWGERPPFDTWLKYERTIADVAVAQGFHYLDQGPLVVDDVAFVGCVGWYDYGFRPLAEPAPGVRVTPVSVSYSADSVANFKSVPGAGEMSWDELTDADFAHKGLVWQTDGAPRAAVWNDGIYIDWGRSDQEMTRWFVERLRAQIAEVSGDARRLVGVTHFVPFAEFVPSPVDDVKQALAGAYLGSPQLGEVLRESDALRVVIFGHRHHQEVREVDGVVAVDASVARESERPLVLTLPD
jgi:predicted phosphodiesterase